MYVSEWVSVCVCVCVCHLQTSLRKGHLHTHILHSRQIPAHETLVCAGMQVCVHVCVCVCVCVCVGVSVSIYTHIRCMQNTCTVMQSTYQLSLVGARHAAGWAFFLSKTKTLRVYMYYVCMGCTETAMCAWHGIFSSFFWLKYGQLRYRRIRCMHVHAYVCVEFDRWSFFHCAYLCRNVYVCVYMYAHTDTNIVKILVCIFWSAHIIVDARMHAKTILIAERMHEDYTPYICLYLCACVYIILHVCICMCAYMHKVPTMFM